LTFSVGSLATSAGVSRRTVRFYVQERLLEPPIGLGRWAQYTESHLARLLQIKSWQEQGLPLEAIRARLELHPSRTRGSWRQEQRQADGPQAPPIGNATSEAVMPGRAWMHQPVLAGYELHVAADRPPLTAAQLAALARSLRDIVEKGDTE
jgi:DNA-binding transcriptional MerR regulator